MPHAARCLPDAWPLAGRWNVRRNPSQCGAARRIRRSRGDARAAGSRVEAGTEERVGRGLTTSLRRAVLQSSSRAEVQRRLGYRPSGGIHRLINAHIKRLGLDTSHFTGQSWMKGRRFPRNQILRSLESILVADSGYRSSGKLRERLVRAGLQARRCECCGLDSWQGKPLTLQLDHINGDPSTIGSRTFGSSARTATPRPIPVRAEAVAGDKCRWWDSNPHCALPKMPASCQLGYTGRHPR